MAISYVNSADLGNNGGTTNTLTSSYTIGSGSNRRLWIGIEGDVSTGNTGDPTTITYNGVTMVQAAKNLNAASANLRVNYLYYLDDPSLPSAGTYNVVVTFPGNQLIILLAAEYNGVLSGSVDNIAQQTSDPTVLTLTTSITTVADSCWVILQEQHDNTSITTLAGAGSTLRTSGATFNQPAILDSGSAISPAGSHSMTTNFSGGDTKTSHLLVSFTQAATLGDLIILTG